MSKLESKTMASRDRAARTLANTAAAGPGKRTLLETLPDAHGTRSTASSPIHTAAHEAAHVVQQRAGVQVAHGVGQAGDVHERNADALRLG